MAEEDSIPGIGMNRIDWLAAAKCQGTHAASVAMTGFVFALSSMCREPVAAKYGKMA